MVGLQCQRLMNEAPAGAVLAELKASHTEIEARIQERRIERQRRFEGDRRLRQPADLAESDAQAAVEQGSRLKAKCRSIGRNRLVEPTESVLRFA